MTKQSELSIEIKAVDDENTPEGTFSGILSNYGNVDLGGDVVENGAFAESLKKKGLKRTLLWQHNWDEPIGQFTVKDSDSALNIDGSFNLDTVRGREAYSLLKRNDINGLSIGYMVEDYKYDEEGVRHLLKCDLMEGSLVTFPMNTLCLASAKSMMDKSTGDLKTLIASFPTKKRKELKDVIDGLVDTITEAVREAFEEVNDEDKGEDEDDPEDTDDVTTDDKESEGAESEELTDEEVDDLMKECGKSIELLRKTI